MINIREIKMKSSWDPIALRLFHSLSLYKSRYHLSLIGYKVQAFSCFIFIQSGNETVRWSLFARDLVQYLSYKISPVAGERHSFNHRQKNQRWLLTNCTPLKLFPSRTVRSSTVAKMSSQPSAKKVTIDRPNQSNLYQT